MARSEYALFVELNLCFAENTNGKQGANLFADIIAEKNGKKSIPRENIIYGDNMPNSSKLTIVRSIRASKEFWKQVKKVAEKQKTDTNKLIVNIVTNYCNKEVNNGTNN